MNNKCIINNVRMMKAPEKGESSPLLLLPLQESPKPKHTVRLKEVCKYISANTGSSQHSNN